KEQLRPKLEFFRDAYARPFFHEIDGGGGNKIVWLRIGVRNVGGTAVANARVVLEGFAPINLPGIYVEHELQPMGREPGTRQFDIPPFGTAIVDVASETVEGAIYG